MSGDFKNLKKKIPLGTCVGGGKKKVCAKLESTSRRGGGGRSQYFDPELALIVLLLHKCEKSLFLFVHYSFQFESIF